MRLVDEVVAASASSSGDDGGSRQCPVGFAIVRPPGHHSGVDSVSGFCLLNNVAIAARHAQQQHKLRKVGCPLMKASGSLLFTLSAAHVTCVLLVCCLWGRSYSCQVRSSVPHCHALVQPGKQPTMLSSSRLNMRV